MKIILMRHGQPELDLNAIKHKKLSPFAAGKIIDKYEETDLAFNTFPPSEAVNVAKNCRIAISSDLVRAVSSIQRLGIEAKATADPDFRESNLPYLKWQRPHLSFYNWCLLFRILWLFGFAQNGESIRNSRKRAKKCVIKLCEGVEADGTVLLLGHGIINRLIASELKKLNWVKIDGSGALYWSYMTFQDNQKSI